MSSSFLNVIGVQFRRAGKIYEFDAGELALKIGDSVVVETERGPSLAQIARLKFADKDDFKSQPLKKVVRVAGEKDMDGKRSLTPEEVKARASEMIDAMGLKMRVLHVEIQFGASKAVVYFSAAGRVDFRDLVKELAAALRSRVELKQVGARDEAKLLGGVGICGREFCCSSFLREFVPVSIKMAKNQNLALNPTKISGGCGRLLCCLTYEDEVYAKLIKRLPPIGARVMRSSGDEGDVVKSDFFNQLVVVETESGEQETWPLKEVKPARLKKPPQAEEISASRAKAEEEDWGEDLDLETLGVSAETTKGRGNTPANRTARVTSETSKQASQPAQSPEDKRGSGGRRSRRGKRKPRSADSRGANDPKGGRSSDGDD